MTETAYWFIGCAIYFFVLRYSVAYSINRRANQLKEEYGW